jgi:hypothetical protein
MEDIDLRCIVHSYNAVNMKENETANFRLKKERHIKRISASKRMEIYPIPQIQIAVRS